MATTKMKSGEKLLKVHVTDDQLELLRVLDFPCTQEILAKPARGEGWFMLRMSRMALEDFVGWVAGKANHERKKGRAQMLNDIADEMESALESGPGSGF